MRASLAFYALWQLLPLEREEQRAQRITREAEELRLAGRFAYAFHEPAKLKEEHREFVDSLGLLPSAEEALAEGAEMLALAREQGWIVAPSDAAAWEG